MSLRFASICVLLASVIFTGCKAAPIRSFGDGSIRALAIAISHDGQVLAAGATDGTVRIYDIRSGRELARQGGFNASDPVQTNRVAFSPDATRIAFSGNGNTCMLWSWFGNEPPIESSKHPGPVRQICFAPDGTRLLTASGGFGVDAAGKATAAPLRVLSTYLDDGHELTRIDDPPGVLGIAFASSGDLVATARVMPERASTTQPGAGLIPAQIAVRSIKTGQTQQVADADDAAVGLSFSPDQQLLLCGRSAWDVQTGLRMKRFDAIPSAFVDPRTVLVLRHGSLDAGTAWFQPVWVDVWTESVQQGDVVLHDAPEISSILPSQFAPDFGSFFDQRLRQWKLPPNPMAASVRRDK